MVYVISVTGRPLMPTERCGKMKHLLWKHSAHSSHLLKEVGFLCNIV